VVPNYREVMAQMDKQYPPGDGTREAKKKFRPGATGRWRAGCLRSCAIEYLYESGMECAIVSGASSGAMNAVTLAGRGLSAHVLRTLWEKLVVEPPVPFIPSLVKPPGRFWKPSYVHAALDYWNALSWTYFCKTTPLGNA